MHTRTIQVREGDNVGPIDWSHPTAKDMPLEWREAEKDPDGFTYNGRTIIQICMYDGWPYWKPTPAVNFIGPLKSGEWNFFDSYGASPNSVERKRS